MAKKSNYQELARKYLEQYQAKLFALEQKEMILLGEKWGIVSSNLEELIKKLAEKEILSENQLFKLELYKEFLKESKFQVNKFNEFAAGTITDVQRIYAKAGLDIAQTSLNFINPVFNRMNIDAINKFIGISSDGSPIYDLLKKSYPDSVDALVNDLLKGTALGWNPEKTAKIMVGRMNGNYYRALMITRTEQQNILRMTSIEQYKESGVCNGWQRIEQSDCCDECADVKDKIYGLDEPFESHPNCRGAAIPVVIK